MTRLIDKRMPMKLRLKFANTHTLAHTHSLPHTHVSVQLSVLHAKQFHAFRMWAWQNYSTLSMPGRAGQGRSSGVCCGQGTVRCTHCSLDSRHLALGSLTLCDSCGCMPRPPTANRLTNCLEHFSSGRICVLFIYSCCCAKIDFVPWLAYRIPCNRQQAAARVRCQFRTKYQVQGMLQLSNNSTHCC